MEIGVLCGRTLEFGLGICLLGWLCLGTVVRAEAPPAELPRYLGLVSAGIPLRLTLDETLGQKRIAPAFADVLVGYALAANGYRHGFGLGVSWNMLRDGGHLEPVYGADQIVLMPAYLGHYALNFDLVAIGHVGIPILISGGPGFGFEAGLALGYRLFAGAGLFSQIDLDAFTGVRSVNLFASLELGVFFDFEVLP